MTAAKPKILKFKKIANVEDPSFGTDGAAGYDLTLPNDVSVDPRRSIRVPLGIAVEIPEGYVGLLRLRSSMGSGYGLTMVSSGIIDSDYRGELCAFISSHHNKPIQKFNVGTKMFQLVVVPCLHAKVQIAEKLSETPRGDGGFGSTDDD